MKNRPIKRVFISVEDTQGIIDFAHALRLEFGAEIFSTGKTARYLEENGVHAKDINIEVDLCASLKECDKEAHTYSLGSFISHYASKIQKNEEPKEQLPMFDLLILNPGYFGQDVPDGSDVGTYLHHMNVTAVSALRGAAKNFSSVAVVARPSLYNDVLKHMRLSGGCLSFDVRAQFALDALSVANNYDQVVANWFANELEGESAFPDHLQISLSRVQELRYGENPHQKAAFYKRDNFYNLEHSLAAATQYQGKALSYNNYLDLDAAWSAVREYSKPACAIVKHTALCGISECNDATEAYKRAFLGDPISAFGGIIALNTKVDVDVVEAIFENKQYVEAFIAPEFTKEALELYKTKPKTRLLATGGVNPPAYAWEFKSVEGGLLCQECDSVEEDPCEFNVVTKRKPSEEELKQLVFAWKAVKSLISNGVLIARNSMLVGACGGQPDRIRSCRVAVEQAGGKTSGAVAASDAFFAFRDSIDILAEAGITAIIEPGGSIRDQEIIDAANERGIAVVFTNYRHFKH